MNRLARRIGVGAAMAMLSVTVLGGAVEAAPDEPPTSEARTRRPPVDPTGRAASPNAMRSGFLSCGDVVTRSVTLKDDVGPCDGPGIIVGADNVTLDLNGYSVIGNFDQGAGGEFGGIVLPRRTGVRVVGNDARRPTLGGGTGQGTVEGFEAGVVIRRGSGNEVRDLTVQDNVGPDIEGASLADLGDGIIMFNSSHNRILNNGVFRNGYFEGIGGFGVGTDSNLIQGNTSSDNLGTRGIVSPGAGIALISGEPQLTLNDNRVIDNIVEGNFRVGINLSNTLRASVLNNVATANGFGGVFPAGGITMNAAIGDPDVFGDSLDLFSLIEGNTTSHNFVAGILLDRGTSSNIIRNNVALENDFFGIANGFRSFNNLYDSNTSLGHDAFFDLFDGAFPDDETQCGSVWVNNVFETASPECAANGGAGSA